MGTVVYWTPLGQAVSAASPQCDGGLRPRIKKPFGWVNSKAKPLFSDHDVPLLRAIRVQVPISALNFLYFDCFLPHHLLYFYNPIPSEVLLNCLILPGVTHTHTLQEASGSLRMAAPQMVLNTSMSGTAAAV